MQATGYSLHGVGGSPLLYHSYQHTNGAHTMQHQDPTQPDNSRHFSQIRPELNLQQQHAIDLLIQGNSHLVVAQLGRRLSPNGTKWHEYEIASDIGDKPCHQ